MQLHGVIDVQKVLEGARKARYDELETQDRLSRGTRDREWFALKDWWRAQKRLQAANTIESNRQAIQEIKAVRTFYGATLQHGLDRWAKVANYKDAYKALELLGTRMTSEVCEELYDQYIGPRK